MAGKQRKARALAFQTLFEADAVGHAPQDILARALEDKDQPQEVVSYARDLIEGVLQNKKAIDEVVQKFAPTWPIEQIAGTDRNILRLAIFEILLDNRVPVKAAINEAVELAKTFGSESSFRFVNGVLGSIVSELLENKNSGKEGERNWPRSRTG